MHSAKQHLNPLPKDLPAVSSYVGESRIPTEKKTEAPQWGVHQDSAWDPPPPSPCFNTPRFIALYAISQTRYEKKPRNHRRALQHNNRTLGDITHDKTGQDRTRQDSTRQDRTGQARTIRSTATFSNDQSLPAVYHRLGHTKSGREEGGRGGG